MGTSCHWGRSHIRKQAWWKGLWVQFLQRCRRRNIGEEVHNPVWLLQTSPEDGSHTFSLLPISFLVGRIIVSSHWHNTLTYDLNKLINPCPIMQKLFPVLLRWSSGHYIWMTEFYIKQLRRGHTTRCGAQLYWALEIWLWFLKVLNWGVTVKEAGGVVWETPSVVYLQSKDIL